MRSVISFSATKDDLRHARRRAVDRGFESVSEYFRFLLREDDGPLISEDELVKRSVRAEKWEKQGKLVSAKSLADFLP